MSTVNVKASGSAAGSIGYALYGNDAAVREQHLTDGTTRATALTVAMVGEASTAEQFVLRAETLARARGRSIELYSYTQNFSPDEFDVTGAKDVQRVHELGVKMAQGMHSADHLVVTHTDSIGGHLHNHVYVINHDNLTGKSLQRYTSWKNGLHQFNDQLMAGEGCRVLPSPERPLSDWEDRREDFAAGGFERALGDKVAASLRDPRSVDEDGYTTVLAEQGVRLARTARDGWTYKMRREDNGKPGRKKASRLAPEFTRDGAQEIFQIHHDNRMKENQSHGHRRRPQDAGRAAPDLGDVRSVDLSAGGRGAAGPDVDRHDQRHDHPAGDRGQQADDAAGASAAAAREALDRHRRRREAEREARRAREAAAAAGREPRWGGRPPRGGDLEAGHEWSGEDREVGLG